MKFLSAVFVIIATMFLFIACDDNNHNDNDVIPDEISNAIWPFIAGSYWKIDVWDNESGDEFEYVETYRVDSIFIYNQKRVARISLEYSLEDTIFARYYLWWGNTAAGLFIYAIGDTIKSFRPYETPLLSFEHPANDGEIFNSYAIHTDEPDEMSYLKTGVPDVTVPAGTFSNCVFYSLHLSPATDYFYYFKPDTGYIYMEKQVGAATVKTRSLREFNLE